MVTTGMHRASASDIRTESGAAPVDVVRVGRNGGAAASASSTSSAVHKVFLRWIVVKNCFDAAS